MSSIYEEIGGKSVIEAAVDDFYALVLLDPELKPYFANTDMRSLRNHQVDFLVMVAGGPVGYSGRDLKTAHAGRGISESAFEKVTLHLKNALVKNSISETHRDAILQAVHEFQKDVVE